MSVFQSKNSENSLCTKNSEHFGDYPYFANLNTRTELVLFQQLTTLSNNKDIKIRSLVLTKHHSFTAQSKHRRESNHNNTRNT